MSELEQLKISYEEIKTENTVLKSQNTLLITERDELKSALKQDVKLTRRKSEEVIKTKSKAKRANADGQEDLQCEFAGCENKAEDALIKCNACGKWICEACSGARIAKLKPCINNCGTIFFACSKCAEHSSNSGITISIEPEHQDEPVPNGNVAPELLVSSMKSIFKDHVTQIEATIESLIDKKLNEKIPTPVVSDTIPATDQQESYARKVLQVPEELRKIIQDAKNDDKVEENEQEKRATNFIIHGAEECGDNNAEMKKLDNGYVDDILKQLGVQVKPESVIRSGISNDSHSRPIKVTMKTKADKQKTMSRLNRLKGTEEKFGKISITEDYTKTEKGI